MSNLQSIMQEIKKTKAVAESKPGENVQTRRIKAGKIMQAKESLKDLYTKYREEIKKNSIFILAVGSEAEKFAKTAEKEYQCFAVKADGLYEELLEKVPTSLYMNKLASRNMFEHLQARLEERAMDIGIMAFQPLYFEAKFKKMVNSKEEALDLVKRAINDKVGAELVGIDAIERVSIEAVNRDFEGQVMPIVLYTNDNALTKELTSDLKRLTKKIFVISSGNNVEKDLQDISISDITKVTKKSVEETLVKIKNNVL